MMSGSTSEKAGASSICRCSGAAGASDIMLLRSVWRIWLLFSRGNAGAAGAGVAASGAVEAVGACLATSGWGLAVLSS